MKITGTLINYYFHCKRQCYLHGQRINLEDNSEEVRIGKVLHEMRTENKKKKEVAIENIKIDKMSDEYVTEIKKSDADIEAAKWQLLLYLSILKSKGIERRGKLEFVETNKQENKIVYISLTQENEMQLQALLKDINALLEQERMPVALNNKKCKKCAYYEYCYI